MNILRSKLQELLIKTGRLPEGSTITIESVSGDAFSDYRRVEVNATKKRCRKPYMYWNICINIARDQVIWDSSTFYYL